MQTDTAEKTALAQAGSAQQICLVQHETLKSPTAMESISGQKYLQETLTLSWTFTLVMPHITALICIACPCSPSNAVFEPATTRSLFHSHLCQLKSLLNAITNDLACSASPQFSCLI